MELIKRKILLEDSIDRNYNSPTYGIVTGTSFYIKVMLTSTLDNIGLFTDTDFIPNIKSNTKTDYSLRLTGTPVSEYFVGGSNVTAFTDSKLQDIRTYNNITPYQVGVILNKNNYINFSGENITGISEVLSIGSATTYVVDADINDQNIGTSAQTDGLFYTDYSGITRTYIDSLGDLISIPTTILSYKAQGKNETTTSLSALIKEEYLFGVITSPEINNDIFIDRGILSPIESHLRLSEIKTLDELSRYGNGFYTLNKQ